MNKRLKQKMLLVDAGNSAVKWSLSSEQNHIILSRESYPEKTSDVFFNALWKNDIKPDAVFVSCVANKLIWKAIEQVCLELWQIKAVKVVSPQQGQGVTNAYSHASDLGSDRWCAILAAHRQAQKSAAIVIDCGTAITIDVVNPSGQHSGGYILPGLEMMQSSLGMQTANIKLDQNKAALFSLAPADSTSACVLSGALLAAVAAIDAVVMEQQKEYDNVKCYLTGGDAHALSTLLSVQHSVIPELVLQGLELIAANDLNLDR